MARGERIVILGSGPTGLGAAWRLQELGYENWSLYEAAPHPGGLASSFVDDHGFTWDLGGHVLFSHYKYFDNLMNTALGDQWAEHIREAWVWMRERWIPYPLQNNIWRLPTEELLACIDGLLLLRPGSKADRHSFRDWLLESFGPGLCESFMFPYNKKVWAYDPSKLDVGWMGERVATVDVRRIVKNIVLSQDDVGWGPNSTFRFPLVGGTGAIWRAISGLLPASKMNLNRRVVRLDLPSRTVTFADGEDAHYDRLISTLPLDCLLRNMSGNRELSLLAENFVHSSSHIVGVGIKGTVPDHLKSKCWMYFPEPNVPFYRCTVFSNYSPFNVPHPGQEWSLMAEVSESPDKPVDGHTVVNDVVAALHACKLLGETDSIISRWHRRLEYGYPTPWLGRQTVLDVVESSLTEQEIYSRGRFGAWKYEVSNQDHSVMQGVEVVNRILCGSQERTYHGIMSD